MSLSARFGLTVTFQRPEKARFAAILEELAKQHHIQMPMEELLVKAEAFAIRAGGRSPRVAKTVHRTVRERRAEIMFAFSFLWIRKKRVQ